MSDQAEERIQNCIWKFDETYFEDGYWDTSCNNAFCFSNDGGPKENAFMCCPFCGHVILEVLPSPEDEEEI